MEISRSKNIPTEEIRLSEFFRVVKTVKRIVGTNLFFEFTIQRNFRAVFLKGSYCEMSGLDRNVEYDISFNILQ